MTQPLHALLEEIIAGSGKAGGIPAPGHAGAAAPYLLAASIHQRRAPLLIITPEASAGKRLFESVTGLLGSRAASWFPPPDAEPYESLPHHPGILLRRSLALCHAVTSPRPVFFLPAESLLWRVPTPGWLRGHVFLIEEGEALDRPAFRLLAWRLGYRSVDLVSEPGEVALRGGIVDVFPPDEKLPIRAELFGDEVDALRFFDPTSQRSLGPVGRPVPLPPLSETIRDDRLLENLRARLRNTGDFGTIRLESLDRDLAYPTLSTEVRTDGDFYGPLWDHFPGARWVWIDRDACIRNVRAKMDRWAEDHRAKHRPEFVAPGRLFASPDLLSAQAPTEDPMEPPEWLEQVERPLLFPGDPGGMLEHLGGQAAEGMRVLLLLQGRGTMSRLTDLAADKGLHLSEEAPGVPAPPGLYVQLSSIAEGVSFPRLPWTVVTEREIFGRSRALPSAAARRRDVFFANLRDLKVGDAVVHVDHGIGVYDGIETLERGGRREDFMILRYAGGSRLLVPVQRMDLIQKYVGPEGHRPALDRLGGQSWKKAKAKVRKAVKEMAGDLLRLYSKRRSIERPPAAQDTELQEAFESQFPHELTSDQVKAIADIRKDMEGPRPMDRLVCGDVGFGKTEVAMRAAFQAVTSGRQVAVLCPTTVLALQHMERFSERFAPFPAKVAMLSRFVPPPEQRATAAAATKGEIDVLIGTHRILSKDVDLPNLGLLIIDEEQRFGVSHKEKIKQLRTEVDALTLTATPIPRTLQMGLSSIMDVSLIQTPPKDRLSIQTTLHPLDKDLVVSAVKRELLRNGQVFYVHNKVETIAHTASRIKAWVPNARVVAAHGQMGERALEDVITAFFRGEYDILVCTTIIENGIDLPRANTLIVENAHAFGLSQLYQLRGRIGRSDLPAYAYLLTPDDIPPRGDAFKRLETLREFTELGSGFRIAAVDLELRGAGEFLGAEQSGHMAALGFDLYLRMLEEAVSEARGESASPVLRCEMNLGLDLSIPMEYIEEVNQRLTVYRDLSLACSAEEVETVESALIDRYGPPPDPLREMLRSVRMRIRAEGAGIRSVRLQEGRLQVNCDPDAPLDAGRLVRFLTPRMGVQIHPGGSLEVPLGHEESPLSFLEDFFGAIFPEEEAS